MSVSEVKSNHGFDLDNRDPTDMNEHVRVWFEDAFAEPDGTHSTNGVWSCSFKTFACAKSCCYIFLSFLCGGPCALMWGLLYACQSCYHIWCIAPCIKSWRIDLGCCALCWSEMIHCCFDPIHDSISRVFSNVKFHHRYEVV